MRLRGEEERAKKMRKQPVRGKKKKGCGVPESKQTGLQGRRNDHMYLYCL